jgi:hypothetical protein
MKRRLWLLLIAGMLAGSCATTQQDQYPDEEQIRGNAKESQSELDREERKQK